MSEVQSVEQIDNPDRAALDPAIRPHGVLLEGHAIAVDAGVIRAVLPLAEAGHRFLARSTVRLPSTWSWPAWSTRTRTPRWPCCAGSASDLPLQQWLTERIWPLEQALVGEDFVHDGARLAAVEMLRAGVTTCSDMYFYPDHVARALTSVACGRWSASSPSASRPPTRSTPTTTCARGCRRAMRCATTRW